MISLSKLIALAAILGGSVIPAASLAQEVETPIKPPIQAEDTCDRACLEKASKDISDGLHRQEAKLRQEAAQAGRRAAQAGRRADQHGEIVNRIRAIESEVKTLLEPVGNDPYALSPENQSKYIALVAEFRAIQEKQKQLLRHFQKTNP